MEALAFVDKVQAMGEEVLKVELKQPHVVFLSILADGWAAIMPKHIIEARGDMRRSVVGTGPFKLKSHNVGASMEVVRNPDYFVTGKPYLDSIVFYPIRDVGTAKAAFKAKRVNYATNLTMTTTAFLALKTEEPEARVEAHESTQWWSFFMPVDKAPWNDMRVRRAVYLGLDRHAFVKLIEQEAGIIGSFVPSTMGGLTAGKLKDRPGFRQPKDADRAEAKRLLAEAGYAAGFSTKMLHRSGGAYESAAVLLKSELATISINVELSPKTEADLMDFAYRGDYHSFMVRNGWKIPDPDGVLPGNYRSTAMRNYSHLIDKETDRLIDEQSITTDPAKRKEILREIDRRLTENLPAVTTHWSHRMYAWWPGSIHYVFPFTGSSNVRFGGTWLSR